MTVEYEAYLAHFGVKGQKWGQRRFQNEDGTLTTEGKRRYGLLDNELHGFERQLEQPDMLNAKREALIKQRQKAIDRKKRRIRLAKAVLYGAAAYNLANMATGFKFKNIAKRTILKAGAISIKGLANAAVKAKNSQVVNNFIKNMKYRKMGARYVSKRNYQIGFRGLPSGH